MASKSGSKIYRRADLRRNPALGSWRPDADFAEYGFSGGAAWQSNGGAGRRHPARAFPLTLEAAIPEVEGRLNRVLVAGVFALYCGPEAEPSGALGASIRLMHGGEATQRIDLVQGRHYSDAKELGAVFRRVGDGTEIETAGQAEFDHETYRVDVLSFEVPDGFVPDRFVLHDLGTPASFAIFDVVFEFEEIAVCPFRGMGQKVGLGEIGSIMRLSDRVRFDRALQQLSESVMNAGDDLDEARGLVLTFQAAVTAGLLEMGGSRNTHRYLLDSARSLDEQTDCSVIAEVAVESLKALTRDIFGDGRSGTQQLIDDALEYVERSFGEGINDAMVAERLGLSTSHFRHLFKQATRQPFHQYMLALRLEKSREMILQTDMGIAEISQMCGFASPAHFSRVFSGRFGAAPSVLRGADK